MKILTTNIKLSNQSDIHIYESRGGYKSAAKAMNLPAETIVEEVKASGLRGRGGAGFPTGIKWGFVPKNQDLPTYLVMNADESEPGTFKDKLLLEQDPHLCLEGLIIAAKALNVHLAIIYIRGEYAYGATVMQKAIKQAYLAGYLGEKIFKSKYALDVILHRGAGAYICGEETALLNSIEGKRGQPRLKPPFPAVSGLYGCPTIINNVETLANLPWIIEHSGSSYAKIGTAKSTGTKLISVSGNVSQPGVYEVELGYPVLDFIQNECRGIANGKKLKAVIPGGSSVAVLRADELNNLKLDYESLLAAGSMLGSGGMIVLDETIDMVEVCANLQNFYAYESCGQCTPCREGGHWVEKLCRKLVNGTGTRKDLDLVQSVCSGIAGKTICPFGDALVSPTLSFIKKFPEEFEKKIFRIKTYVR
ncbi:MAG: NADH-quinone oxidoreductase subunit NuoF [Deltaproteobacteria bacterium]|jgi:NADH-quinone oxidoreductase subunit F|nr:NADH-quinone oxidoreductase subunit NuoF [Deltaproteobacteria bacterium]